MVRIRVVSDLHLEAGDLEVPNAGENVVVLAGDVHVGIHSARLSLGLADKLGVPVVLVAGITNTMAPAAIGSAPSGVRSRRSAAAVESNGRLVFLEREAALVAGVRFVGATLWTEFRPIRQPGGKHEACGNRHDGFRRYEPSSRSALHHRRRASGIPRGKALS
jgi:hypothetical protein